MRTLLAKLDVEGFLFDVDGDLPEALPQIDGATLVALDHHTLDLDMPRSMDLNRVFAVLGEAGIRSEEHTSELQSLMRISYADFCLKKKRKKQHREFSTKHHSLILHTTTENN